MQRSCVQDCTFLNCTVVTSPAPTDEEQPWKVPPAPGLLQLNELSVRVNLTQSPLYSAADRPDRRCSLHRPCGGRGGRAGGDGAVSGLGCRGGTLRRRCPLEGGI